MSKPKSKTAKKAKPKSAPKAKKPSEKPAPKTAKMSQPMKAGLEAVKAMSSVRAGSKLGKVIELLSRPNGATLEDLVKATEWQKHTVRSAISHTLVKKHGYKVTSEKPEGGQRTYKIEGGRK